MTDVRDSVCLWSSTQWIQRAMCSASIRVRRMNNNSSWTLFVIWTCYGLAHATGAGLTPYTAIRFQRSFKKIYGNAIRPHTGEKLQRPQIFTQLWNPGFGSAVPLASPPFLHYEQESFKFKRRQISREQDIHTRFVALVTSTLIQWPLQTSPWYSADVPAQQKWTFLVRAHTDGLTENINTPQSQVVKIPTYRRNLISTRE